MGMAVCLLQFYFINILVSGAELGESHWNCKQHWLWCLWQCHGASALFIPGCTTHTAFREYFQTESLISTYVESSQSSWELSSLLFNFFYLLNVCQRWKFRMIVWRNFAYEILQMKGVQSSTGTLRKTVGTSGPGGTCCISLGLSLCCPKSSGMLQPLLPVLKSCGL